MYYLRHTWKTVISEEVLYNLDVSVNQLDTNWPIIPKNESRVQEVVMEIKKSSDYSESNICDISYEHVSH